MLKIINVTQNLSTNMYKTVWKQTATDSYNCSLICSWYSACQQCHETLYK